MKKRTKKTLVDVLMKACDDKTEDFFNQLVEDPDTALKNAGIQISPIDRQKLIGIIGDEKVKLDFKWVVNCCRRVKHNKVKTEQRVMAKALMPGQVDLGPWKF